MKRVFAVFCLVGLLSCSAGCGSDDKKDAKQPKLSGPPDPKIMGPAAPGAGGGAPKGGAPKTGDAKPGSGVD